MTASWDSIEAKKMFGGIGYLMNGNMICGIHKQFLVLRLGTEQASAALDLPHVKPFDITGRAMKGWVMMEEGFNSDEDLLAWLNKTRTFVSTLPPK